MLRKSQCSIPFDGAHVISGDSPFKSSVKGPTALGWIHIHEDVVNVEPILHQEHTW
jgi:hypothetical protein